MFVSCGEVQSFVTPAVFHFLHNVQSAMKLDMGATMLATWRDKCARMVRYGDQEWLRNSAGVTNMALDDITLLPDLSDSAPAGDNLELDPDFGALERASRGKPEQQYGDTIIPAEPADWKQAESLAMALQDRTRDLRILTVRQGAISELD